MPQSSHPIPKSSITKQSLNRSIANRQFRRPLSPLRLWIPVLDDGDRHRRGVIQHSVDEEPAVAGDVVLSLAHVRASAEGARKERDGRAPLARHAFVVVDGPQALEQLDGVWIRLRPLHRTIGHIDRGLTGAIEFFHIRAF